MIGAIEQYEENNGKDRNTSFLKSEIKKLEYIEQINQQIGILEVVPIKSQAGKVSIESLDKKVGNIHTFQNIGFPFDFSINQYQYLEDIIQNELIPNMIKFNYLHKGESDQQNKNECSNRNLELDVDMIIDFLSRVSPQMDSELFLKYLRMIIGEVYSQRNKQSQIDYKKWTQKNIKLYKTDMFLNDHGSNLLDTILVVRKFEPQDEDEKYIFYTFSDDRLSLVKSRYQDMIDKIKSNQLKICSKFSQERKEFIGELEI